MTDDQVTVKPRPEPEDRDSSPWTRTCPWCGGKVFIEYDGEWCLDCDYEHRSN